MFAPHAALILGLTLFALILFTIFYSNTVGEWEFDQPVPECFTDTSDADEQPDR